MVRWLIRVVHDGIFDGTIFWHIRELWNNASQVAKVILTLVALFAKVQMSNSTANRSSRTQGTKKLVKLEIHFVETDHRCSECHEWKPFPPRYFQYSRECVYIDNIKEKVSSSKNQDRKQTHVRLNDATRTNYSRWISKKFIFSKKKKNTTTTSTTTSTIESKYFSFASHFDLSKKIFDRLDSLSIQRNMHRYFP